MFLKLTLYNKDPELRIPVMINMDKVVGYGDCYDAEYIENPISHVKTLNKKRTHTCLYIGEQDKSNRDLNICETMEEINLKMAQLERRSNGNSNRKG